MTSQICPTLNDLCGEFSTLLKELEGKRWMEISLSRRHEMAERMIAIRKQAFVEFGIEDFDNEVLAFEGNLDVLYNHRNQLAGRRLNQRGMSVLTRLDTLINNLESIHTT